MKVLDDNGKLVDREGDITLRMLLAHTAGFGYSIFVEKLRTFARPVGFDEFSFDEKEFMSLPLAHQPGTKWEYGVCVSSLVNF
jgi:CubicO group peptidase (beta-lactamase class C family)